MDKSQRNLGCLHLFEHSMNSLLANYPSQPKASKQLTALIKLAQSSLNIEAIIDVAGKKQHPMDQAMLLTCLKNWNQFVKKHSLQKLLETLLQNNQTQLSKQKIKITHEALRTQLLINFCFTPATIIDLASRVTNSLAELEPQQWASLALSTLDEKALSEYEWFSELKKAPAIPVAHLHALGFTNKEVELAVHIRADLKNRWQTATQYNLLLLFKDYLMVWQQLIHHKDYRYAFTSRERSYKERFKKLCLYTQQLLVAYPRLQPVSLRLFLKDTRSGETELPEQTLEVFKSAWQAFNLQLDSTAHLNHRVGYIMRWDDFPFPSVDIIFFFNAPLDAPQINHKTILAALLHGWQAHLPEGLTLQAAPLLDKNIQQDNFQLPLYLALQLLNQQCIHQSNPVDLDVFIPLYDYWSYKDNLIPWQAKTRRVSHGERPKLHLTAAQEPTVKNALKAADQSFARIKHTLQHIKKGKQSSRQELNLPNALKQLKRAEIDDIVHSLKQQFLAQALLAQIEVKWGKPSHAIKQEIAYSLPSTIEQWLKEIIVVKNLGDLSGWIG